MKKLTPRQAEILEFIQATIKAEGWPPTRQEIAKHFNFKSLTAASDHIKALEKKGYIEIINNNARGLRLKNLKTKLSAKKPLARSKEPLARSSLETRQPLLSAGLVVPIIGQVAAGSPTLASENLAGEINLAEHTFAQQPDYFLQVKGLSMLNAGILEGDLLAVKKTNDLPRNGQLVVARLGDEVTVKRFAKQGSQVTLQAENPDYADIQVNLAEEELVIEGLAVGLLRQGF